jgi:DNA helicase IV
VPATDRVFELPARLSAKDDPALIGADKAHFDRIAETLARTVSDLTERLAAERTMHAEAAGERVERDMEIRRLAARLRTLERYGLDLTLGRMVPADGSDPVYIGRLGLTDAESERLLVDWRSPAAEPFFGATHADPMGLASRRRYRWTRARITDYWDEVFTADGLEDNAALDDQSAFIASLGTARSATMRDVLGTIQSDQDAIIRAGSRGALVVDGGPGTGKTVVALHRAAYLVYADPRLARRHGGVLFVGPHPAYLAYVADVLPSLGEDGVQLCTLRDIVPEGATARPEQDAGVARLKASRELVDAVERAVRGYKQAPKRGLTVETDVFDVDVDPGDWADAFGAADPASTHNENRDVVWEELVQIVAAKLEGEVPDDMAGRVLHQDETLRAAFARAWPLLDPIGVVADLFTSAAFLRACAPQLGDPDIRSLHRDYPRAWTVADLPLLDAARQLIGDPAASGRARREAAVLAAQREEMSHVIDHLIASAEYDDGEGVMRMLGQQSVQDALIDETALPLVDPDALAGPFAHIVVDEAQELTDAEWTMLLRRCPSRSFTIVGDRAQARHGFPESWAERLERVGLTDSAVASLTINYRTPEEVMAEAEPVIRAVLPDANVPTSIRRSGVPVKHGSTADRDAIVEEWLGREGDGIAAVIGDPAFPGTDRVRSLTPEGAKGLEFDLVVLVDPERWGDGIEGGVDRYVAMTRSTRELAVLSS